MRAEHRRRKVMEGSEDVLNPDVSLKLVGIEGFRLIEESICKENDLKMFRGDNGRL